MDDNFENKVYNVFKSIGCTESKCKEVMNLISDDDLSCISGGKGEARKEIIKKILSLGIMATSVCPTVLPNNNTYANSTLNLSNEENINENILEKNQEQDPDNNININLKPETIKSSEDLNNKKNEDKSNEKETPDHVIQNNTEFNKNKTKSDYVNVNNDNKNQAIKYYNYNNHWNTVKKAVIGTGALVCIPTGGWLLYSNFFNTNGKEKLVDNDITIQIFANNLNSSIRSIYKILGESKICQEIVRSHTREYKFDVSDIVNSSQQDLMSSCIGMKNNLDSFSAFFYKAIYNWNELNTKSNDFDCSIVFDISNDKPVSFEDFISHVEKFRVSGESCELKEFYKIIEGIKDIKPNGGWFSGKSILDLKIVFCNKKLHGNTQHSNLDGSINNNHNTECDDYRLNLGLASLLTKFKEYYLQILHYVVPSIKTNSAESILGAIKKFKIEFDAFKNSKNWCGIFKRSYRCDVCNTNDPLLECRESYDKLKKLINLEYVTNKSGYDINKPVTEQPYEFWNYLENGCIPVVGAINDILKMYNKVNSIKESSGDYSVRKQIGEQSKNLDKCTKKLHDKGYKDDENFKQFKEAREEIWKLLGSTTYLS